MSVITISTPFNIDLEFKIAPMHKRVLAWIIDTAIIYGFIYLMFSVALRGGTILNQIAETSFAYLFVIIPAFGYHLILEMIWQGQTVGKRVVGVKVIDMNGNEPSPSQFLLRWVLRLIDIGLTMGFGAVLSITLSGLNQRLGDLAAGTVVIDNSGKTGLNQTIYVDLEEDTGYKPAFPEVMRLTDRDINGIRNLLDSPHSKDTEAYTLQVAGRIQEVLQLESDMEPRDFLEQLLKDYNFLTRR